MYLLDTNVISELRKANTSRIDPNVARWAVRIDPSAMFLSAIVVEELEVGVLRLQRRDPASARILRIWLETRVLPIFRDRVLPVDTAVALTTAALRAPVNRPYRDSLIAATAAVHGLTVATRNSADFVHNGVPVINPWDVPPDSP
ncbi:MAG TPA: type II toxin-antitoxin system VapC family toxin [Rhodopila sp.]|uniref:type II toxin-antitoxin system VapC family toxin n=1 Tax=Rhodopila sp. TaxID=2480087 RepID=UPI002CADB342|nr:type II toxin-antitoxin system VapC family toxin [Rhodopila sp.]HVY13667.1 type II toxin-antitoxin system VapC family toxin [Rhodopila sp.]